MNLEQQTTMSRIHVAAFDGIVTLGVAEGSIAETYVRIVDTAALQFYERTNLKPNRIRVPLDWAGALHAAAQRRYNFTSQSPATIQVISGMKGNGETFDVVTFPFPTTIGSVNIEADPTVEALQVYGESR